MPKTSQVWRNRDMGRVLIVYGTTEGHTEDVAAYMADVARRAGAEVDIADSATVHELSSVWDAVIVGASVHQSYHQTAAQDFVKANLPLLQRLPSAFFSVSLAAAVQTPERQAEARGYLEAFLERTGWQPQLTISLAGALRHTEYDAYKVLVLDLLAYQLGGGTVVPQDVVYTDWDAVEGFVGEFLSLVARTPKTPSQAAAKAKSLAHLPEDDLNDWR